MDIFFHILGHNIVPIFLLIAAGFCLSKKFSLDIFTLSKLNFYIFTPGFMFVNLYTANIDISMLQVLVFGTAMLVLNDFLAVLIGKWRNMTSGLSDAFKNTIMFNNCGNIGISLVTLVFSSDPYVINGKTPYLDTALSAMIVILMLQNIATNTLGFFYAGRAKFKAKESLINILSMPTIYVIPLVLALKMFPFDMKTTVVWPALEYISNGLVPIALLTLGVQLSRTAFDLKNIEVSLSAFARLVLGPLLALIGMYWWGFYGIIAQTVLIACVVPTAVNVALIAVECDNFPDFSSQAVMLSTLLSTVTLTFVIYAARIVFPI